MSKAAFIGLGSMGAPQARLIAREGFDLSVYDPFPAALQRFEGVARLATSARDAAQDVDTLSICVRDDDQVRDVIFGPEGAAAGLKSGSMILIHSTIRPSTLRDIRAELAGQGITVLDAPVSRTRQTDDDRFVVTMIGGEGDEVARARAVIEAFSTEIRHVGPAGAGMAVKIANNMVTWVHIVVGTQAAAMAEDNGVSYSELRAIMQANGNLTPTVGATLDAKAAAAGSEPNPARLEFQLSQTGIGQKDLTLAAEGLEASGLNDKLAAAARDLVRFALTGERD